jgi:hypothetical protein
MINTQFCFKWDSGSILINIIKLKSNKISKKKTNKKKRQHSYLPLPTTVPWQAIDTKYYVSSKNILIEQGSNNNNIHV